jgi:hypothetical protein
VNFRELHGSAAQKETVVGIRFVFLLAVTFTLLKLSFFDKSKERNTAGSFVKTAAKAFF